MNTPKTYIPSEREDKWYKFWIDNGFFNSIPDERPSYTIVIPPPNVTGVLHMGHTLNNTIQDILIRKARMQGFNACWVPGTDHASIATEAKVVDLLKKQNIDKFEIGREKFLGYAFEWKEKYGGIILEQLKKLGASCDWNRTAFTMDNVRYNAVVDVFVRLFDKGLIYRGIRMVNWDPSAKTAVSDEEVFYKETTDKLYYVKYKIEQSDEFITVATTRPETIMADTAVCVNPKDPRFKHLVGKNVLVPMINRKIPVIQDEYVDIEFGTGCLKITPAHDINDYNIGIKHKLPIIDILNDNGTLNEKAALFVGLDREDARKKVADYLGELGQLSKVEDLLHNVGHSERSGAIIEPKLSLQWFCKMPDLAKPALAMVMDDTVQFHPAKFKNTYRHWMENIKDWCISRQLWWGHRIPAWYLPNGEFIVAKNIEDALEKALKIDNTLSIKDLKQEGDVLDTWFSSWLWPLSVFDGIENPDNEEINYYYPTKVLVTAPDIIFFWVARMIMAGIEYRDQKPFDHVYFTGIVRDEIGRKMSKQLGNSPDLLDLIKKHGADSVRFGILISSPAGNDLLFGEKLCEQGGNFINKIWNAYKLIESWTGYKKIVEDADAHTILKNSQAASLFESRLSTALVEMENAYKKFKISEALQLGYKLIWDDFCSNYLEWVKPRKDTFIDLRAYQKTLSFFETCIKILHPFMPFITEEIFQLLSNRANNESICLANYPDATEFEAKNQDAYNTLTALVTDIRSYKTQQNIPLRDNLHCAIVTDNPIFFTDYAYLIKSAAGIETFTLATEKPSDRLSFMSKTAEIFDQNSNLALTNQNLEDIVEEIKRLEVFLISVTKKLNNERFVSSAPVDVVEKERKKQLDTEQKLALLKEKVVRIK